MGSLVRRIIHQGPCRGGYGHGFILSHFASRGSSRLRYNGEQNLSGTDRHPSRTRRAAMNPGRQNRERPATVGPVFNVPTPGTLKTCPTAGLVAVAILAG